MVAGGIWYWQGSAAERIRLRAARNAWLTFWSVLMMWALPVPPAWAMAVRFMVASCSSALAKTPTTKVGMEGVAPNAFLATAEMPLMAVGMQLVGNPSVARSTAILRPGLLIARLRAWSSAPASAGAVGVSPSGILLAIEAASVAPAPGSALTGTAGVV